MSDYTELKLVVEDAGFFTTPMPIREEGDRIVLASRKHRHCLAGNSFWVAKRGAEWYLGTWGGYLYRIPDPAQMANLCLRWLRSTDKTMSDLDDALKRQYGLVVVADEQADSLFPGPDNRELLEGE